jgi:tetratricopeptide (TPR) repeat protein/predicted Ser/Thr protein kinase
MALPDHEEPAQAPAVQDLTGTTVGRFAVSARLGAGGMGEVYRAEDTKLKRSVALKRLAPHLQADAQYRQRFWKEAERASSLNDPHIAAIYDIFEARGESFLVMEFVEGVTLRRRLQEPFSVMQFLPLAVECAQALAAAHEKGIIHRDIKPENIMLTPAGQVKVLDFGVAKRLAASEQDSSTATLETTSGAISGTAGYMAPEVLLEKEPDGRADIFSLGVVFYEMVSGRHPFLEANFVATSDRILHDVPPPLSRTNPQAPRALDRIVANMLAKDPAQRYATARELADDLRALTAAERPSRIPRRRAAWRLTFGIAAVVVVALLLMALPFLEKQINNWRNRGQIPRDINLAVLPIVAVGGGPKATAFGDGLTETLTAKLTQLTEQRSFQVVPSNDIRARHITLAEQARKSLGVNLVLQGSLHQVGDYVRVNLALVNPLALRQIRAESITAPASDPFAVEDKVVGVAVDMLGVEVRPQERPALAVHGTQIPGAFDLYLRGRGYLQTHERPGNIDSAISAFQRALQLDPGFALASAGLGEAYWRKYETSKDSALVPLAGQACDRALIQNAGLAESHICLGGVQAGTGHYAEAVAEFDRALEMEPTRDDAYRGLALAYERMGKLGEAEKTYRRAIEVRPEYWAGYNWLGAFYYRHAQYADAAGMFSRVVRLVPDSYVAYNNLCVAELYQGQYARAIATCQRSIAIHATPDAYSNLATSYFYMKKFGDAARTYQEAIKLNKREYIPWGNLGDACSWAPGQQERAFEAYRRAISLANERLQVNPRDAQALGYLAWYHAALGEKRQALACAQRALRLAPHDPELLFNVALTYNQLGEIKSALDWLEKALQAGFSATTLRDTPNFAKLRDNPRFQNLLKK